MSNRDTAIDELLEWARRHVAVMPIERVFDVLSAFNQMVMLYKETSDVPDIREMLLSDAATVTRMIALLDEWEKYGTSPNNVQPRLVTENEMRFLLQGDN